MEDMFVRAMLELASPNLFKDLEFKRANKLDHEGLEMCFEFESI